MCPAKSTPPVTAVGLIRKGKVTAKKAKVKAWLDKVT